MTKTIETLLSGTAKNDDLESFENPLLLLTIEKIREESQNEVLNTFNYLLLNSTNDKKLLIDLLISNRVFYPILKNLFTTTIRSLLHNEEDRSYFALQVITYGTEEEFDLLCQNLEKLKPLNNEVAEALIETDKLFLVLSKLDVFENFVPNKEMALTFLHFGRHANSVNIFKIYIYKYEGLDMEVCRLLLKLKQYSIVTKYYKNFEGLVLDNSFMHEILESSKNYVPPQLLNILDQFTKLDDYVRDVFIYNGFLEVVMIHSENSPILEENVIFSELNLDKKLALYLIEIDKSNKLINNIKHFKGLDLEILILLIEKNYIDKLNFEGFYDYFPYLALEYCKEKYGFLSRHSKSGSHRSDW